MPNSAPGERITFFKTIFPTFGHGEQGPYRLEGEESSWGGLEGENSKHYLNHQPSDLIKADLEAASDSKANARAR